MKKLYIIIMCMCIPVLYAEDLEDTFSKPVQGDAVAPAPAARSYGSAGSVHSLQGEVTWHYSDRPEDKKAVRVYSPISSEAVLEVDAGSWLIIAIRDGSGYIYLGPETKAKIIYAPYKQGSHWVRIELLKGTARACCTKLSKLYSCFAIVTPNASIGTSKDGDILVQYSGPENGISGVTVAESMKGEMSVSHIPIADKLAAPMERKVVAEGKSIKVYTRRPMIGPGSVNELEGKQAFWSRHNVSFKGRQRVSRHKARITREIERLKSGEPRLTPHTLAR